MPTIESLEEYCDTYDKWFDKNLAAYHSELNAIRKKNVRRPVSANHSLRLLYNAAVDC